MGITDSVPMPRGAPQGELKEALLGPSTPPCCPNGSEPRLISEYINSQGLSSPTSRHTESQTSPCGLHPIIVEHQTYHTDIEALAYPIWDSEHRMCAHWARIQVRFQVTVVPEVIEVDGQPTLSMLGCNGYDLITVQVSSSIW